MQEAALAPNVVIEAISIICPVVHPCCCWIAGSRDAIETKLSR